MNINANIRQDTIAAATRKNNTPHQFERNTQQQSPGLGTVDTVEISLAAREAAQIHLTTEEDLEKMNREIQANWKERARDAASFTAEDVAPLKARFANLLDNERGIYDRIAALMAKGGFARGLNDQVKVEIDANGKAIVGGITDAKAARALEKAINSDKKLLNDIVEYQKEEKLLSGEMREVTGMSLKEYASRIDSLQRRDDKGAKLFLDLDTGQFSSSPASAIALRDQDLYAVDEEFAAMISGRYAAGSAAMDISGQNNILEDAEGTVNRMMTRVTGNIKQVFNDMNKGIRMAAGEMPDSAQYVADSIVDLSRLNISVDHTGKVTVEGTASKNNPETDRAAKKIIEEMFEEELKSNPVTGAQHDFKTAAAYLLNAYDETFGEDNPLGLGEAGRTLETVYSHGEISSHVSSPEREEELATAIDAAAKDALKDMGVDATDVAIAMNDEGKLVATNINADAPKAQSIQTALDLLNKQLENRSIADAREEKSVLTADPVKRLKGLMLNMDVLRPGGASLLQRGESAE